jgi:hypothetical protein
VYRVHTAVSTLLDSINTALLSHCLDCACAVRTVVLYVVQRIGLLLIALYTLYANYSLMCYVDIWTIAEGNGCNEGECGFGNKELQTYTVSTAICTT